MERPSVLEEVIAKAGGITEIARVFGIAPPSVCAWRRIPAERVLRLEKLTGVSRHAMRPDVFGERS